MTEIPCDVNRLIALLGADRLAKLIDLLGDVVDDTGYGELVITVHDHQVQTFRSTKTWKKEKRRESLGAE